ncbi:MAG: hypothetical protein AAGA20_24785, partial [Planctomycetota bacterium]
MNQATRPGPSAPFSELRVRLDADADAALDAPSRGAVLAALLEAGHPVSRGGAAGSALATLGPADVPILDREPDEVVADVTARRNGGGSEPGAWTPWFPVIDYDRCTNCMQCLSFCLFDVYS